MKTVIERLLEYVEHRKMKINAFEKEIGVSNGYFNSMKGRTEPSIGSNVIKNLIQKHPELNIAWLLTGEGKMINEKSLEDEKSELNELQRAMIQLQKNLIKRLQEQVKSLGGTPVE